MERIELKFVNLRNQEITKQIDGGITLYDDVLHYRHKFRASEPIDSDDKLKGWEEVKNQFERIISRDRVACLDLEFIQATEANQNQENRWMVTIVCDGASVEVKVYFETEPEAKIVYNKLVSWKYGNYDPSS